MPTAAHSSIQRPLSPGVVAIETTGECANSLLFLISPLLAAGRPQDAAARSVPPLGRASAQPPPPSLSAGARGQGRVQVRSAGARLGPRRRTYDDDDDDRARAGGARGLFTPPREGCPRPWPGASAPRPLPGTAGGTVGAIPTNRPRNRTRQSKPKQIGRRRTRREPTTRLHCVPKPTEHHGHRSRTSLLYLKWMGPWLPWYAARASYPGREMRDGTHTPHM